MSEKKYKINAYAQDPESIKKRTNYASGLLRDITAKAADDGARLVQRPRPKQSSRNRGGDIYPHATQIQAVYRDS